MWKLCGLVCLCMLTMPVVASTSAASAGYQPATITSVQKMEVTEPPYSGGDNPSDAPLQSHSYAYNVRVKTGCGTYIAHYESPYDYLPSAFAPNHELPVRVVKGAMQFDLGYRTVQMTVTKHKDDASCSTK